MEAYQGQGSYEPSADELIDVLKNLENLAAANPALYKAIVDQISGMLKKLLLISDLFYLMCFLFHILPLAVCHDQNQSSAGESSHKNIFCIASLKNISTINTYSFSMTSLLTQTVAQPTKGRFLPKNLS